MIKLNIGDKVQNIRSGNIGIVVRIFESGSIGVLENICPCVICTHESEKTLKVIEENCVCIFDERR